MRAGFCMHAYLSVALGAGSDVLKSIGRRPVLSGTPHAFVLRWFWQWGARMCDTCMHAVSTLQFSFGTRVEHPGDQRPSPPVDVVNAELELSATLTLRTHQACVPRRCGCRGVRCGSLVGSFHRAGCQPTEMRCAPRRQLRRAALSARASAGTSGSRTALRSISSGMETGWCASHNRFWQMGQQQHAAGRRQAHVFCWNWEPCQGQPTQRPALGPS